MIKRILWGFVAAFVVAEVCDYLINNVIMASAFLSLVGVLRPDMRWEVFPVIAMFVSFLFSFIFSKGYEGKGIMEGMRYGFYIGLIISIPFAYGQFAAYPVPYGVALQWFIYGTLKFVLMGIAVALVFGKITKVTPPAA